MNQQKYFILLFVLISLLILAGCSNKDVASQLANLFELNLIHLNDTHSHLDPTPVQITPPLNGTISEIESGDMTRITKKITQLRSLNPNSLFLHAGDMTQGTLYFVKYQGDSDLFFFNNLKLDAMVTGNHEYDNGPEHLASFIKKAQFPILAANVDSSRDHSLQGLLKPYIIKEINGEKIGIIGIVTSTVPDISSPGDDLLFTDELKTAQKYILELESKGINKIILLTHIGYENDINLALKLKGADIIVGGHSHSLLGPFKKYGLETEGPYPTVLVNDDNEKTLIVQAWNFALVLGSLKIHFNQDGTINTFTPSPVMVINNKMADINAKPLRDTRLLEAKTIISNEPDFEIVDQDKEAVQMHDFYEKNLRGFKEEVLAETPITLKHIRVPNQSMPHGSLIAPIVCESMLWKMNILGNNVDFALQNAGGVRTDINKGNITVADVFTLLPFKNTLVTFELTGKEIKDLLEKSISSILDNNGSDGAFPYVAGLRYNLISNNPAGDRVQSLKIKNHDGIWLDVRLKNIYKTVTNSYLARGKNSYNSLGKNGSRIDTGLVDAHVFMEYLRNKKKLVPIEQTITLH